jgi:hypothetical protein
MQPRKELLLNCLVQGMGSADQVKVLKQTFPDLFNEVETRPHLTNPSLTNPPVYQRFRSFAYVPCLITCVADRMPLRAHYLGDGKGASAGRRLVPRGQRVEGKGQPHREADECQVRGVGGG